jgi:hypothetical protein
VNNQIYQDQDSQIPDVDYTQYFGTHNSENGDWKDSSFQILNQTVNLYDFVTIRLFEGEYKLKPMSVFNADVDSLCADFKGRANAVQEAVDKGIHLQPHPETLPENIFGADGEWESYSTPGRDLRLRKRVLNLVNTAKTLIQRWLAKDPLISYEGANLKQDFIRSYLSKDANCKISFKNSKGEVKTMGLSTAVSRLTLQSFDPFLCPELRWGARFQSELKTCEGSLDKYQWHEYQQFLRNQRVRDPGEVMGWSLEELEDLNKNAGPAGAYNPSDYDIIQKLKDL